MGITMKLPRRRFFRLAADATALTILALTIGGQTARSQMARTIKIVAPVPPGGPLDFLARLFGEQISRLYGPTIIVENRPGAAGAVGTQAVARAAPDGNTLLIMGPTFVIRPQLQKMDFDPFKSFEPVCYLANSPLIVSVNNESPYRTLADLIAAARVKPGELTLGSLGPGTPQHIAVELLKRSANVDMNYVPYPGDAPAVTALLGAHVTSVVANYQAVSEQLKAGKLRALATASPTRIVSLPEVPTIAESGFDNFDVGVWYGIVAPAQTPKEILSELAGMFTQALQEPGVKARLVAQQLYPVGTCGSDYADYLHKQYDGYGRIIRDANRAGCGNLHRTISGVSA
jgi:tripartite-type tricarboxylate transporter receptor subunit TctC